MDFMPFFLLSFAVWRVASLFAREDGPFDVFIRFRVKIGVKEVGTDSEYGENWFTKGILCVWCSSIWFAAFGSPFIVDSFQQWIIYTLAASAMAILLDIVIMEQVKHFSKFLYLQIAKWK